MGGIFLGGGGAIAEVPVEGGGVADALGGVVKFEVDGGAYGVGDVEVGDNGWQVEVELDDSDVAVVAAVVGGVGTGRGGEVVAATGRANGLVDTSFVVEPARAAIHMLAGVAAAEEGAVHDVGGVVGDA